MPRPPITGRTLTSFRRAMKTSPNRSALLFRPLLCLGSASGEFGFLPRRCILFPENRVETFGKILGFGESDPDDAHGSFSRLNESQRMVAGSGISLNTASAVGIGASGLRSR